MVEKQDSLNKIRESNKKIVEGGKKFGRGIKNVGGGTVKSIFYTLKSASESGVSKVYKNKSENLDLSDESREKYKNKSKKYSNKSKESIIKAGKGVKQGIKGTGEILSGGIKVAGNSLAAGYHGINYTDKKLGQAIEKRQKEKGKNNVSKLRDFFRYNILKLLIAGSVLGYGGTEAIQHQIDKSDEKKLKYVDKFGNGEKIFIIDVSEYNEYDAEQFAKWNNDLWNSHKPDTRGVSGVYMRIQKENGEDSDYKKFYEGIKEYNKTAKRGREIAVGGYVYFDKRDSAITDEGIKKQVNDAIKRLNIINFDFDGVVDLTPMLDFEYKKDPGANSERGKKLKRAVLKRLQLFEEKTGLTPGIYTGGSIYHDYFLNDPDFKKYPVRIASYNKNRVNQSEDGHSVRIGPMNVSEEYTPHLIQFTEEIRGSGFGTEGRGKGYLDGNTTTQDKFKELIIMNADAPSDLKSYDTINYRAKY